jgi:PII-like signaling protein
VRHGSASISSKNVAHHRGGCRSLGRATSVRSDIAKSIAGATAWTGIAGYGAGGRLHHRGLFGVSDEKPVMIAAIDEGEKLRAAIPSVLPMVKGGLVLLQDIEICNTEDTNP